MPLVRSQELMDHSGCCLSSDDCISDRISSLNVGIARVNFTIHCSDAPLTNELQSSSYTPFITDHPIRAAGSFTVDVTLEIRDLPSSEGLEEVFEDCGSWSMLKKGIEYYLVLNPGLPDGPESIIHFEPLLEKVIVYCGDLNVVSVAGKKLVRNPFIYPLDQLLLMYALAERKGALVHAAGLDYHGKGFLFAGRSGAGKSTLARNFASKGYEMLSDDRIVTRRINGSFRMFGTPWPGEAGIALNKDLPLDGIFFIRHGTEHVIKELKPAEAVERLMPVTSIPWFDRKTMLSILSFCEDMTAHVPAYELSFRPDNGVVDALEEFLSE